MASPLMTSSVSVWNAPCCAGGARLTRAGASLSHDSRHLFCAAGPHLRVISATNASTSSNQASTSSVLREIQDAHGSASLSALELLTGNDSITTGQFLATAGFDGTLRIWDAQKLTQPAGLSSGNSSSASTVAEETNQFLISQFAVGARVHSIASCRLEKKSEVVLVALIEEDQALRWRRGLVGNDLNGEVSGNLSLSSSSNSDTTKKNKKKSKSKTLAALSALDIRVANEVAAAALGETENFDQNDGDVKPATGIRRVGAAPSRTIAIIRATLRFTPNAGPQDLSDSEETGSDRNDGTTAGRRRASEQGVSLDLCEVHPILRGNVRSIAVSGDAKLIAAAVDTPICAIWVLNAASGDCIARYRQQHVVTSMQWHPFDSVLATGNFVGHVNVWHGISETPVLEYDGQNVTTRSREQISTFTLDQLKSGEQGGLVDTSSFSSLDTFVDADRTRNVVVKVMHWHAHAVGAVAFTGDGAYLLSGGEEAVVVMWQLATEHSTTIPRVGAPIIGITVDPHGFRAYALVLADNSIKILSGASQKMLAMTGGLRNFVQYNAQHQQQDRGLTLVALQKHRPAVSDPLNSFTQRLNYQRHAKLAFEPRDGLLVTNRLPGALQFYAMDSDVVIRTLEVSATTQHVSRMYPGKAVAQSLVEHFDFSPDGNYLATVDCRRLGHTYERTLKFWVWDQRSRTFVVNTRVEQPHRDRIADLAYHPRKHMVVTTSGDGRFKIWIRIDIPDSRSKEKAGSVHDHAWSCRSVGTHKATSKCKRACFSPDGSLLAIAYEDTLTLWNPTSNRLIRELTHFERAERIHLMAFVVGARAHNKNDINGTIDVTSDKKLPLCVTASHGRLYVWDLLRSCVTWSYRCRAISLAVQPAKTGRFVVGVAQTAQNVAKSADKSSIGDAQQFFLVLFHAASPTPLMQWSLPEPPLVCVFGSQFVTRGARSSIVLSSGEGDSELLLLEEFDIASSDEVLGVERGEDAVPRVRRVSRTKTQASALGQTTFGQSQFSAPNPLALQQRKSVQSVAKTSPRVSVDGAVHPPGSLDPLTALAETPTHALPPLSMLSEEFISSLIRRRMVPDIRRTDDIVDDSALLSSSSRHQSEGTAESDSESESESDFSSASNEEYESDSSSDEDDMADIAAQDRKLSAWLTQRSQRQSDLIDNSSTPSLLAQMTSLERRSADGAATSLPVGPPKRIAEQGDVQGSSGKKHRRSSSGDISGRLAKKAPGGSGPTKRTKESRKRKQNSRQ